MSEPNYSIVYSAKRYGSQVVARGNLVVPVEDNTQYYVVATTDNRNGRRCEAISLDYIGDDSTGGTISIQQTGVISAGLSGLAAGSASWVRCSSTGTIERCNPSGSDDVIGYADADGRVHLLFGILTPAITGAVSFGAVSPEQYDAVGDGSTDDTDALQAALDAIHTAGGGCLALTANKSYLITSALTVYANTRVTGQGQSSVISSVSNATFLLVSGDNVTIDNLLLSGTWGAGTSQHGISVGAYVNFTAHNVTTYALGGHSFRVTATAGAFQGHRFSNCVARFNLFAAGFYISGEYCQISNCHTYGTAKGLVVDAGNITASNCSFAACNTRGVEINGPADGVSNDAHGIIDGCHVNHTTSAHDAVYVSDIANGFVFTGCHIYYGDIRLVSSNGVRFVGCTIDVDNIYFDGSQGTDFDDCTWPSDNANTIHYDYNSNASTQTFGPRNLDLTGRAILRKGPLTTADATVTTLDSITLGSMGITAGFVVTWLVTATKSDGTVGAGYTVTAAYRMASGTCAQIGSASVVAIEDGLASAWDCTADLSGSTARLRVTGATATSITWSFIRTQLTVLP